MIIKRRFVQGGEAQVIPERAPGRTVSVRTEEREVVLARYGCDIEMSTNLSVNLRFFFFNFGAFARDSRFSSLLQ